MIQSFINTITPLIANTDSVQFDRDCIRTNGCNNWLCHNQGSANYDIVCGGLYEITFNASVSSATAGVVAFALFNNVSPIKQSVISKKHSSTLNLSILSVYCDNN